LAKIHFTRHAREDLLDIWLFVARRDSEALADANYDRIEAACARLVEHPQLGRARPEIAPDARALCAIDWTPK
jgi:toxin ParE1/3/4